MKRIHEVILDLDDVLNQFCMAAMFHVGVGPYEMDYAVYPQECGWDIVAAANKLRQEGRPAFTDATFWEALGQEFWATTPCVYYLDDLLEYLAHRVGSDNITIATSPTLSPECVAGKLEWIQTYLPKWCRRQFMIGPCKHLLANPFALLIDDREENCVNFMARGGSTLLVHKPWNYSPGHEHSYGTWVDWEKVTLESIQVGLRHFFGKAFQPS